VATVSPAVLVSSESHALRVAVPGPLGVRAESTTAAWVARNWSGYAINTSVYTSVSGTWTVPTVSAPPHPTNSAQYSATWVGIDGFNLRDHNLIQAGTEQDWNYGTPSYQAWWEILPMGETVIPGITVRPGDAMTVSIVKGVPDWTITVSDATTGQTFTTKQTFRGKGESAEWIQEAPTVGGRVAPLANFGTVDFSDATANGTNPGLNSSELGIMAKGKGGRHVISTPSLPNATANGFAVAYGASAPLPPA
jgi:hypothetical protein